MTPAALTAAGRALYGPSWKRPLAGALGITERTLYRWLDGTSAMPAVLPNRLAEIAEARVADIGAAMIMLGPEKDDPAWIHPWMRPQAPRRAKPTKGS